MNIFRKYISLALAVALLASLLGGCILFPAVNTDPSTAPSQTTAAPTTQPTTEPTTEPATVPATEPTTAPTTEPTTEPTTAPTTQPTTAPTTEPTTGPTAPALTEPWSSQEITVGPKVSGINAKKAFVYDCESKSFLYMKSEADAKLYPASITKLMNVYTALKYLDTSMVVTMGEDVLNIVPSDTSKANIPAGTQLTVEMVIRATLVPSGSDAAHLLAVTAGRVITGDANLSAKAAEDAFAEEMNRQAQTLGLVNTHFVNCDGYPDYYHYTCMADLVTIATHCLETPMIRDTVKQAKTTITYQNGTRRTLSSTNWLLKGNKYYRSEACGMKTGTTDAAGNCLLSAFWINGKYMIIGVFQAPTFNSRYDCTVKLFDTFKNHVPPVVEPDPTQPTTPSTETAAPPSSEVTAPSTEVTKPSTGTTEPSPEATQPSSGPTEPSSEPTEPSSEVTSPSSIPQ